jgi:hypothetical protein
VIMDILVSSRLPDGQCSFVNFSYSVRVYFVSVVKVMKQRSNCFEYLYSLGLIARFAFIRLHVLARHNNMLPRVISRALRMAYSMSSRLRDCM